MVSWCLLGLIFNFPLYLAVWIGNSILNDYTQIIRIEITPQLLKIHLTLFIKSSRILRGWRLNKWLRLTDPNQKAEEDSEKPPQ